MTHYIIFSALFYVLTIFSYFLYETYFTIFSFIVGMILTFVQYYDQKKTNEKRHSEYVDLANRIYDSDEASRKIEDLRLLLKKKNISIPEILKQFDDPVYSIFVFKWNEVPKGGDKLKKPLKDQLEKLNFQIIGNGFYMLLPKNMPKISNSFSIDDWTEKNIISKMPKNATYTLNFVSLVDLRKVYSFKTVKQGNTVFDILSKDSTFILNLIEVLKKDKRISFKEIIEMYSITDIISLKLDKKTITHLDKNSNKILKNLNCSTVIELCNVPDQILENEISKYITGNISLLVNDIKKNSKTLECVC